MHRDRIVGLITTILGAVVAFGTTQIADSNMPGDPGPKIFPFICAGILLVCGVILLVRKPAGEAKPFLQGQEIKRFLTIIALIAVYIALMWAIGFSIPTFLMVLVMCLMFGRDAKVPLWQAAVYALLVTGVLYVAFVMALHLRLPVGSLIKL